MNRRPPGSLSGTPIEPLPEERVCCSVSSRWKKSRLGLFNGPSRVGILRRRRQIIS